MILLRNFVNSKFKIINIKGYFCGCPAGIKIVQSYSKSGLNHFITRGLSDLHGLVAELDLPDTSAQNVDLNLPICLLQHLGRSTFELIVSLPGKNSFKTNAPF